MTRISFRLWYWLLALDARVRRYQPCCHRGPYA